MIAVQVMGRMIVDIVIRCFIILNMNQRFLTNFSVVVIKYMDQDEAYCLGNESFIRSEIFLSSSELESNFENYLFFVETDTGGSSEFKLPIEFQQGILLRHKVSNKYLSYSTEFEDGESDTTVKLELSDSKCFFKIIPCFQYQTKISNKVKFNEDIYLATQLNSTKLGYLSVKPGEDKGQKRTLVGLNYRSKMMLHSYYELEKEDTGYIYGQAVWLGHIESGTFLTTLRPHNKEEIAFQPLQMEENLQSINGLWLVESIKTEVGGSLHFGDVFRLKSLCTGKYLSFSKNFKLVDNERVYDIFLESRPSQQSKFIFESLKGQQNKIQKGSYLIFRNHQSGFFIGTRRQKMKQQNEFLPLMTFSEFEDEDLFEMRLLGDQEEEAIRFIFSVKNQLKYIKQLLYSKDPLSKKKINEIEGLFTNIIHQMKKLCTAVLFQDVQEELGPSIPEFCFQIQQFRARSQSKSEKVSGLVKLIKGLYHIMQIICKDYKQNQFICYSNIAIFTPDIFKNLGAEELISQIFRNNYSLLCKLPNSLPQLGNTDLINKIYTNIIGLKIKDKNHQYWLSIQKIFDLLDVLLQFKGSTIDINQRLISTQLFENSVFDQILFEIKVSNQRIRFNNPTAKRWMQVEQLRDVQLNKIIQRIFSLLSKLCENRNFISKQYIDRYLNQQNKDGVEVIISYLNIPISAQLSNNLFSLVTNCYIDSSPRIYRYKPLAVITFGFAKENSSRLSVEEGEHSGRLREGLLNKRQHLSSKPVSISNILVGSTIMEPGLNNKELALYKEELNEKIRQNQWSPDLLRSICIMIQLQSYSDKEISDIKDLLYEKIIQKELPHDIIESTMQIFEEICIYCEELQLKKLTTYLKYKFTHPSGKDIASKQVIYMLPSSPILSTPILANKEKTPRDKVYETESTSGYRQQYNNISQTLKSLYPNKQLINSLLEMFIRGESYSFSILSSIFDKILRFNFPKLKFINLLAKCIVITNEEIASFQTLFNLYKMMKHLISISEHWLCSSAQNPTEARQFINSTVQFTNYMFDDYVLHSDTDIKFRKNSKLNMNRQLLLQNIAIHEVVIELLNSNFYLLESKTRKELSNKQKVAFEVSFQFLFFFCEGCPSNTNKIGEYIGTLDRFRDLPQVGQTKLLILLYKHHVSLVKQIRLVAVEKVIAKIIKNQKNKSNQTCEFNPEYVQFLLTIVSINDKYYKKNLQLIYKSLEKQTVLRRILFMQERSGKTHLCLDPLKVKIDPIHIPYLYHKKIFKLMNTLIQNLEYSGSMLKNRIKQYMNIEDIFKILAQPDIYSHRGVIPQLNFLLKRELMVLLGLYLDKNDSLSKLHESERLSTLLDHYINIFLTRNDRPTIHIDNQQIFIPYLQQYKQSIDYDLQNQRDYYNMEVHPFLVKIYGVFEKLSNKEHNKLYRKLYLLLQNVKPQQLAQDHLLKQISYGIDHINLKWRNFVDADQENSAEQKFVKKTVLEILRSDEAYKVVEQEQIKFHELILKKEEEYINVMSKLIKMASEEENIIAESQSSMEIFYQIIHSLAQYLVWRVQKKEEIKGWEGQQLVETLISYVIRPSFEFNNSLARKSFYQILRIFVFLLEQDEDAALRKFFYKIFTQNLSCFRFFNCLRDCIAEVSDRLEGQKFHEQINVALSELYLCGQQRRYEIDKQTLKFLTLLCKHIPFTELLRDQPYASSIDFLDKIYNAFYFMIKRNNSPGLTISISVVDIAQLILDCVLAMLNGCSQTNQNFIIDNKFPDIVVEALKIQSIHDPRHKGELARRDRLLQQVVDFYKSNGIDVETILGEKIKLLDFRHVYLLNRLKYSLLKTLVQCTLANERALSKVRILVPVELLKINLIWIYEDFMKDKIKYSQQTILRSKEPWDKIVKTQNLNGIFLMIGFYYFNLIEYNNQVEKDAGDEQVETTNDEEKEKQKIVKKFFSSISEKEKKNDKIKALEKQSFAEQMKMFYNKYYEAYEFYQKKSVSLQVNVFGNLVKIYFPKIPLCDKLTQKYEEKLIQEAERISQDEKIKSLIQFEQQTYKVLQGQEDYFKQMKQKSSILGKISKIVKNEDDIFLLIWIIACLIILAFLIDDYQQPVRIFNQAVAFFIIPTSFMQGLLLILTAVNVVLALLLLTNLILKKVPFLLSHYALKYESSDEKEEGGIANHLVVFQAKSIISDIFFDLYVIIFCFTSLMHPLFTGFLLVYIVKRIALGQQIVRAIQQTWFSLFVATALLIVFNYIYSIYIYTAYTDAIGYGEACKDLFRCLLMLVDQSLKSGSGFLGTVTPDYVNMVLNVKFLSQIVYILFAQKVIFEIFSGTIIDKFSQLRQKGDSTEEDQKSNCFICGQQRFQIDFELQGFEEHVNKTHNKLHYIYYLFYLRRKHKAEYGIEEHYVWDCHESDRNAWIPDGTSLLKAQKEKEENDEKPKVEEEEYEKYYQKKLQEFKKMRSKLQLMNNQLKEENVNL